MKTKILIASLLACAAAAPPQPTTRPSALDALKMELIQAEHDDDAARDACRARLEKTEAYRQAMAAVLR